MRILLLALISIIAIATVSPAEMISVWKTPDGSLHIGDRAPAGSTLLREHGDDKPRDSDTKRAATNDALARAAADGRQIIQRRAIEREAERSRRSAARAPVLAPPEAARQTLILLPKHRRRPFLGFPTVSPRPPFRPNPARSALPRIGASPFSGASRISPPVYPPTVNRQGSAHAHHSH